MIRKYWALLTAGAIGLFLAGVVLGGLWSRPAARSVQAEEPSAQSFDVPVQIVPGTVPEMLSASYWTDETDNTLLFTPEQIAAFNENNPPYVLYDSVEENREKKLFLRKLPETLGADMVRSLLDRPFLDRLRTGEQKVYINGAVPTAEYWDAMEENCGYDRVPASVTPVYAVCLRRTVARLLPTEDFAAGDAEEVYCDDFVSAEVLPCEGVAVLHASTDGAWRYVLCGSFCGWVPAEVLALCADREEWLAAIEPERFLVVTGSELVLDETAEPTAQSGAILPMGTKLRLMDQPPEEVNGRSTLGCYCVALPKAEADGSLGWEPALIGVSRDVHVGYLPMTSAAVVGQAFKLLGRVYGWGGSLNSNDCSGVVRQVYACCGLELPRNGLAIARLADLGKTDCAEMTVARKKQILAEMPAGTLLYMDGHLMIYLGMRGGEPYVISACAQYIEPGDRSGEIQDAYCMFVSDLELLRRSGNTWLEELRYLLWKDY